MKIKTATILGMIGAIVNMAVYVFYLLLNLDVINLVGNDVDTEKALQIVKVEHVIIDLSLIFSAFTLAVFFYILHKNQK